MQIIEFEGDITRMAVDVIVNAANTSLLPGGGVDGAIHKAAGPELEVECRTIGSCGYGEVKLTKGYDLPAKYVIHAVGPIYGKHDGNEAEILYSCYYESLLLADELKVQTIAFPAISTGFYGYPVKEARAVKKQAINDFLDDCPNTTLRTISLLLHK